MWLCVERRNWGRKANILDLIYPLKVTGKLCMPDAGMTFIILWREILPYLASGRVTAELALTYCVILGVRGANL